MSLSAEIQGDRPAHHLADDPSARKTVFGPLALLNVYAGGYGYGDKGSPVETFLYYMAVQA